MHARLSIGKARPGNTTDEGERLWKEQAEPLLKGVEGLQAIHAGANVDTNEVFALILFESKEASDAYAQSDVRNQVVAVFRDFLAGELSLQEHEIVYQFGA